MARKQNKFIESKDILSCMDKILSKSQYEVSRPGGYHDTLYKISDVLLEELAPYTSFLASQYKITPRQAFLFTVFVELGKGDSIGYSTIAESFNINYIKLLTLEEDFRALESALLIRRSSEEGFYIPFEVDECLQQNKPYIKPDINNLSTSIILARMKHMFDLLYENEGNNRLYLEQMDEMLLANPDTCIAKTAHKYHILSKDAKRIDNISSLPTQYTDSMNPAERMLFYVLCYRYDDLDCDSTSWMNLGKFFDDQPLENLQAKYKNKSLELQKWRVIEYANKDGLKVKDQFKIRDSVKEEIFADCGGLHSSNPMTGTIKAEDIIYRPLFFDDEISNQVNTLTQLLSQERFEKIQTSLVEKGMRTGFTCLFYGDPGTGKTETVYQLARNTGRDIILVDVSKLKSMWVGESEKNLKALFSDYRLIVKNTKITPILLFNEADAIFGIRKSGADTAVEKMENSLQNIILQEMEDLKGILIATTNLTENLDKAFERRFLYKIQFKKPSYFVRSQIWKSMMPDLDVEGAEFLSNKYELSGGQIENIARKKAIQSILTGTDPDLNEILNYCREEEIGSNRCKRVIGF